MERTNRRLARHYLLKDAYVLDALQGITNYVPTRTECSVTTLLASHQDMQDARKTEVQKEGEFKAARDHAAKTEHAFHEAILATKDQVRAQFGADSDEYQRIGMKKKTERKTPHRKA